MIDVLLMMISLVPDFSGAGENRDQVTKLRNYQVHEITVNHPFEPSGLTIKDNQLLTVCDDSKHIYAIKTLEDNTTIAEPVARMNADDLGVSELDVEGITVVEDEIFLVSEVHHKMIRIHNEQSSWVPQSEGVYQSAFAAGLFQIHNAGMEAIAYLGDHTFLLSVERQPRGLIKVQFDEKYENIIAQTNQVFDDSQFPSPAHRKPDLTGFYLFDGVLFALHRNAYMIHELVLDEHGLYQEGRAWSYEHIVKDPKYAYADMRFGHAEGLAVDAEHFYLVLDNNNNPRLSDPNDIRPLLIKAKRY